MAEHEIRGDYIELNRLLKVSGFCPSGGAANMEITAGRVRVDGLVETRKRRKVRAGMKVEYRGKTLFTT
jgi:ribosome-associated protein